MFISFVWVYVMFNKVLNKFSTTIETFNSSHVFPIL